MNLNKVFLIGRIGAIYPNKNPDICNMTIATSEFWKDKNTGENRQDTEWHKISIFGKLAHYALTLEKGILIYVEGQIKTLKYVDKHNVEKESREIRCFSLKRMSTKAEIESMRERSNGNLVEPQPPLETPQEFPDDEIPF